MSWTQLSGSYAATLTDSATGNSVDMRSASSYSAEMSGGATTRSFTLAVSAYSAPTPPGGGGTTGGGGGGFSTHCPSL